MKPTAGALIAVLSCVSLGMKAQAQIAVASLDGKQPLPYEQPGLDLVPDEVAVIEFNNGHPRVVGQVRAPASMYGPPTSVAIAHNGRFAIATNAQKRDPSDLSKFVPDDVVSVIDLADLKHPIVIQTLKAGDGASGVAISRNDELAMVASLTGTVSVYSIAGKTLTPVGRVQLDGERAPVDVSISPDGKTALVTQRYGDAIWKLAIDGTKVFDTGIKLNTGSSPYSSVYSHDGRYAYNTNLSGPSREGDSIGQHPNTPRPANTARPRLPRGGSITAVDLRTNEITDTVETGPTPEHITLSPDGGFIEVTVVNGSSARPQSPFYNPMGLMNVYRVRNGKLSFVAQAKTCEWGQGAAWSGDSKTILLECGKKKEIDVYHFDGKSLVQDNEGTLHLAGRPGAIMTAASR